MHCGSDSLICALPWNRSPPLGGRQLANDFSFGLSLYSRAAASVPSRLFREVNSDARNEHALRLSAAERPGGAATGARPSRAGVSCSIDVEFPMWSQFRQ